jgi:hypothetical protein
MPGLDPGTAMTQRVIPIPFYSRLPSKPLAVGLALARFCV